MVLLSLAQHRKKFTCAYKLEKIFMQKTDDMPMWVFLAFASINSRKAALWLIASCVIFAVYCVPWVKWFPDVSWVATVFRITDWSWLVMMIPITLWYAACLIWVDKHSRWPKREESVAQTPG